MTQNYSVRFALTITPEQFQRYYQGKVKWVSVLDTQSRRIEFPIDKIKPFLQHTGIQGLFEMQLTPDNRFVSLKRLG